MRLSRRHLARLAVGSAATGAFLWLFLREVDLGAAWAQMSSLPLWALAAGLGFFLANVTIMALRWRFLLAGAGYDVPLRALFSTICVGRGSNNVLPARGGDLIRIESMREVARVPAFASAGTLFAERLLDGVMFAVFILAGSLLIGHGGAMFFAGIALAAGTMLGVVLVVLVARRPETATRLATRLARRLPSHWQRRVVRAVSHFTAGLGAFADHRRLALAFGASVGMWLADVGTFAVVGYALGLNLELGAYFLLEGIANLALAVPATAAGIGSFDYLTLVAARGVAVPEAAATAYVLTMHAFVIVPVTLLGALLVRPALPRLFRGRDDAPAAKEIS